LVGAWRALLRPHHHPTGRHRQAQIRTTSVASVYRRGMEAERPILQRLPPTLIRQGHRPRTMRLLRAQVMLQVQPVDPADILHRVRRSHLVPPLRIRRTVPHCNRDRHMLAMLLLPLSARARRSTRQHKGLGLLSVRPALSTRRVLRSTARPVDEAQGVITHSHLWLCQFVALFVVRGVLAKPCFRRPVLQPLRNKKQADVYVR
jgi:hypothetical protein